MKTRIVIASSVLTTCLLVNTLTYTFALVQELNPTLEQDLNSSEQEEKVSVTSDSGEVIFSVQVPSNLPIVVTSQGEVLTATNAKIINNSDAPVEISNFKIEPQSGWAFVDYDSFEGCDIDRNTKNAAFRVGTVKTTGDNTTNFNDNSFNVMSAYDPNGEKNTVDFGYDIKLPTIDSSINEKIADITFIVDWGSDITPTGYTIRVPENIQQIAGVYQLEYNQSVQLSIINDYSLGIGVWESDNPDVISIDNKSGYATAVGEGACTITYTKDGIKSYLQFEVRHSNGAYSIGMDTQINEVNYPVKDNFESADLDNQYSNGVYSIGMDTQTNEVNYPVKDNLEPADLDTLLDIQK